eukprot:CAMPEP_0194239352 /NCGR_PEP_ID=MMETSP0158-20130606/5843_1 /TAXON_ID=33649 /ORGANISM="Thalassionema nitzschioides, Strain L26-B" /LENGTH=335 /DNA_ID=CAMNT_0038973807 /DNA_START=372 /DNA_END=1379 /DNA_ORIENTATION=-
MTLGDNPSVTLGPPLTIEWEHFDSLTTSLDDYELKRGPSRNRASYKIPYILREQILRYVGFGRAELHEASIEIAETKRGRLSSAHQPVIKELMEKGTQSIQRKLKRWIHRTPSDRVLYDKWIDELDGIIAEHSTSTKIYKFDAAYLENVTGGSIIPQRNGNKQPSLLLNSVDKGEEKEETPESQFNHFQPKIKSSVLQLGTKLHDSETARTQMTLNCKLENRSRAGSTMDSRKMAEILGLRIKKPNKDHISSKRQKNNDGSVLELISSLKRLSSSNLMRSSSSGRLLGESSRAKISGEKNATFDLVQPATNGLCLKRPASSNLMKTSSFSGPSLR